jgi:HK97 family phage major capsid protein
MDDVKTIQTKMAKALEVAREAAKTMDTDGEAKEKFEKAYSDFTTFKGELQTAEAVAHVTAEYERVQKPAAEKHIRRMGLDAGSEEFKELHNEVFSQYMRGGEGLAAHYLREKEAPAEAFALLGTQDDLGGFLVPEDFRAEVIKDMAGFAAVRAAGARVVPTSKSQLVFPTVKSNTGANSDMYTSNVSGSWRVEGSQGTDGSAPARQDQPTFGQVRIPVNGWEPNAIVLTEEFLDDAAVPVDSLIAELLAETKALDEDSAFLLGDGIVKPQGIANGGISTVNTGDANLLTYGGLVDLYSTLPAQYRQNAKFVMNSLTFGAILKLESSGGFQLFPANSLPGTLFGKSIVFSEFLPDVAAAAVPIYFGDWRHYVIAERQEFRIKRLIERFAPNVGIMAKARLGGQVVRTAGFRSQTISA